MFKHGYEDVLDGFLVQLLAASQVGVASKRTWEGELTPPNPGQAVRRLGDSGIEILA